MEDLPNGKVRLWCNPYEIGLRRDVRQGVWHYIGNDEDCEKLTDDDFKFVYGDPQPHVIHLFKKEPCKRRQNRMNKIVAAYDSWRAACEALETELGLPEAEERRGDLHDPIDDIVERIKALKAHPIAGARAKATVLRRWHIWGNNPDDLNDSERLIAEILDVVIKDAA